MPTFNYTNKDEGTRLRISTYVLYDTNDINEAIELARKQIRITCKNSVLDKEDVEIEEV